MSFIKLYMSNGLKIVVFILLIYWIICLFFQLYKYFQYKLNEKKSINEFVSKNKSNLFGKVTDLEKQQYNQLINYIDNRSSLIQLDDEIVSKLRNKNDIVYSQLSLSNLINLNSFNLFEDNDYNNQIYMTDYFYEIRQNDILRYVLQELNTTYLEQYASISLVQNDKLLTTLISKILKEYIKRYYLIDLEKD